MKRRSQAQTYRRLLQIQALRKLCAEAELADTLIQTREKEAELLHRTEELDERLQDWHDVIQGEILNPDWLPILSHRVNQSKEFRAQAENAVELSHAHLSYRKVLARKHSNQLSLIEKAEKKANRQVLREIDERRLDEYAITSIVEGQRKNGALK